MFTKEQQETIDAYVNYINIMKGKCSDSRIELLQGELDELIQEFTNNK